MGCRGTGHRPAGERSGGRTLVGGGGAPEREPEGEGGAGARLAPHVQVAAQQPGDVTADGQAEPRAALHGVPLLHAVELLEYLLLLVFRDPGAVVRHIDGEPAPGPRGAAVVLADRHGYADEPAFRRVLDPVG